MVFLGALPQYRLEVDANFLCVIDRGDSPTTINIHLNIAINMPN